jgi:hypothetical protein
MPSGTALTCSEQMVPAVEQAERYVGNLTEWSYVWNLTEKEKYTKSKMQPYQQRRG